MAVRYNPNYRGDLPTKLYRVTIPIMATYSDAEIEIYGLPTDVNDGSIMQDSFTEKTNAMININRMVDLYVMGYPISIYNPDDAKEIFDHLDGYLNTHVNKIQKSINKPLKEDERLVEIDKFLSEMFDYNRVKIVEDKIKPYAPFDTGIGFMQSTANRRNEDIDLSRYKISGGKSMSGYTGRNNNPNLNPNLPTINPHEVVREKVVNKSKILTAAYLNRTEGNE